MQASDDDPLANPFLDPMPQSPFRSDAPQAAPEEMEEPSDALTLPPGDPAQEQPAPNPFATQPAAPRGAAEPDRLPDESRFDPRDDDVTPGSPLAPLPPLEIDRDILTADPKADCQTALRNLKANRLTLATSREILDLRPREPGELPYECTFGSERQPLDTGRDWPQTCYTWKASGLCHKPLYFEQSHMERYGHSWGPLLDPVISGAHFFASVPLLPYKMGLEPPTECIYPLGHYRPGSCAPHYIEPLPWTFRAGAVQAATVTGLIFAVP